MDICAVCISEPLIISSDPCIVFTEVIFSVKCEYNLEHHCCIVDNTKNVQFIHAYNTCQLCCMLSIRRSKNVRNNPLLSEN